MIFEGTAWIDFKIFFCVVKKTLGTFDEIMEKNQKSNITSQIMSYFALFLKLKANLIELNVKKSANKH